MGELIAYAVFGGYFALIGLSFFLVGRSIVDRIPEWKRLAEGRAFLFLRVAVAALGTTWYFMIEYMKWSYKNFATGHFDPTIGQWLQGTALFEEAWSIVSTGPANWWWSSFICTWTVLFTAVVWIEGPRRRIKHSWAYMLLGQLVAMSVATSLFFVAVSLYPRGRQLKPGRYAPLLLSLTIAMVTIALSPHTVGTSKFMPNLLVMHVSLVLPLLAPPETEAIKVEDRSGRRTSISWLYPIYLTIAALIHLQNTYRLKALDSNSPTLGVLLTQIVSHPAQASISFDVIWVFISLALWFLSSGSLVVIFLKLTGLVGVVAAGLVLQVGINWTLVDSVLPIVTLGALGFTLLGVSRMRNRNVDRRRVLMESMGIVETGVVPGTANAPPKMAKPRTLVGFWHPYCNAGGGGERVLWTALSHLQKNEPEVISLVYSGDYPKASKEEILAKIKERFAIELSPKTLHFIPLPSRYLVDDTYWKRFTLLGQSLGSLVLAYEGLCGKDGLWGDIFIDTMGYAFTYPLIRLLTGSEIAIGAYIHYPTVSTDMVKRVKERSFGIENAGASGSWIRTKIKLIYYHLFTTLYATSLLFSEYNMTNSSWTQAHILSLINRGRQSLLASVLLVDEASVERDLKSGKGSKAKCEIVYPPCDTGVLVGLKLDQRANELVSLAQFRPEKEHAKQIHALAALFEKYPQHKAAKVNLTLMGGARHPADEARVEDLRQLARKLGVLDHVEFLVNAPFPEITTRLARASIGLNTMQDEHFGINVVEFMAAGLIPIVHASAGPMMDIVVPYKGQKTGFHAKTAEEFAEAIHQALSLSNKQAGEMRRAARAGAVEKFSEKEFWRHFQLGWRELNRIAIRRRLLDNEH